MNVSVSVEHTKTKQDFEKGKQKTMKPYLQSLHAAEVRRSVLERGGEAAAQRLPRLGGGVALCRAAAEVTPRLLRSNELRCVKVHIGREIVKFGIDNVNCSV
jgi:hypothetical protein